MDVNEVAVWFSGVVVTLIVVLMSYIITKAIHWKDDKVTTWYKIEHKVTYEMGSYNWFHSLYMGKPSNFASLQSAINVLDSSTYPKDCNYRIVKVTEEIVHESASA